MDITGMKDLEENIRDGRDLARVYREVKDMQTNKLHPGVISCTFVYHCVQYLDGGVQLLRISSPAVWIPPVDALCDR